MAHLIHNQGNLQVKIFAFSTNRICKLKISAIFVGNEKVFKTLLNFTENSVQRLGRLAAIFPPQKQSTSNVKEEADETFSSNSTRGKTSYGHSSNLIGGRGRVLGKSELFFLSL